MNFTFLTDLYYVNAIIISRNMRNGSTKEHEIQPYFKRNGIIFI